MCNVRRLALFLFLVFGSGLIPLPDADACHRRGRRAQSCCQATVHSDGCEGRGFVSEDTRGNPTIQGFLFKNDGMALTEQVTISVFNTTDALGTGTMIGQTSGAYASGQQYVVNCYSPTLANGMMIVVYQRGTVGAPTGSQTKITVGGGSIIHRINPVLQP